jgi:tetratricopeptide (TPR) repeat protein
MQQAQRAYEHALLLAGRPHEKIDAVIGLAGILNIVDQLDEEERLLDDTLPLARSVNADAGLAKLLHLKGNIYFPRGNYSACRQHHEEAVLHARASGATETEARALSGLGDSYYAQGRMQQAYELFGECIAMCEQHRYINIEASNRAAQGSTALYLGQSEAALAGALQSAALAHKVGNKRAEIFARMTAGWVLVGTGALTQAHAEVERALALTRSMGASRFDPFLMESQARIAWMRGDHALAAQLAVDAAETVERLKLHRFIGPWVLGTLALFTRDAAVRKRALLQGAAYLTRDCLAHNALRFYVSAAEVALLDGDLVSADFYAAQLADVAPQAPCVWSEHHVALIRAHAQWQVAPDDSVAATLRELDAAAERHGFAHATPRLRLALAGVW